jgi:hypothetical protein
MNPRGTACGEGFYLIQTHHRGVAGDPSFYINAMRLFIDKFLSIVAADAQTGASRQGGMNCHSA